MKTKNDIQNEIQKLLVEKETAPYEFAIAIVFVSPDHKAEVFFDVVSALRRYNEVKLIVKEVVKFTTKDENFNINTTQTPSA